MSKQPGDRGPRSPIDPTDDDGRAMLARIAKMTADQRMTRQEAVYKIRREEDRNFVKGEDAATRPPKRTEPSRRQTATPAPEAPGALQQRTPRRSSASLYHQADMVSQNQDAMRHVRMKREATKSGGQQQSEPAARPRPRAEPSMERGDKEATDKVQMRQQRQPDRYQELTKQSRMQTNSRSNNDGGRGRS